MKAIIFDSGTLITFSMSGLLDLLKNLKKSFNGKFLITKEIEYECIKRPMQIPKYKLGAMRLKELIDDKILEFPESMGVENNLLELRAKEIFRKANSAFEAKGRMIHIIDRGECSCLALSEMLSEKGIENVICIDERTTRMMCEKPKNLQLLLTEKLHTPINMLANFGECKFSFIRSSELVYVAFKKGLIKDKSKEMLDAMLYSVKFKGCAISNEEIREIEKYILL
ncbi:MAG: hypothetical protein WC533_02090 [Candidatus Pacearchaeota archaeon]